MQTYICEAETWGHAKVLNGFGGGVFGLGFLNVQLGMLSPPINPHPPPPGANMLTFCRWREQGKGGNSSEGLAAGLYLRVKKWTRNCSEDIKKIPLKLRSYQCHECAAIEVSKQFFFFFSIAPSVLTFTYDNWLP